MPKAFLDFEIDENDSACTAKYLYLVSLELLSTIVLLIEDMSGVLMQLNGDTSRDCQNSIPSDEKGFRGNSSRKQFVNNAMQ